METVSTRELSSFGKLLWGIVFGELFWGNVLEDFLAKHIYVCIHIYIYIYDTHRK